MKKFITKRSTVWTTINVLMIIFLLAGLETAVYAKNTSPATAPGQVIELTNVSSTPIFANPKTFFLFNFLQSNLWLMNALTLVTILLIITVIGFLWYLRLRRQAEQALQVSEESFRTLFNNSPDMMVAVSPNDASVLLCNEAILKKTGYSKDEIIGSPIFKLYHQDCLNQAKETFEQFIQTGVIQNRELILQRKDGTKIQVSLNVNAVRDNSGRIVQAISSWRDITERKQVEEALKKSEEKFRGIYEQSPIAIQIYDKDGKLIDVNQQTLDLFGIKDIKHILGYDMWTSQNFTAETRQAMRNGQPIFIPASLDFDWVKKSNLFPTNKSGVVYVDLHAAPLISEGVITGYLVQLIDVTERKKVEAQLLQAQKMEAIGRLAGGVAHDFNNILVPIIGHADLGMLRLNPDDKLYTNLKRIQEAAERATGLVRQILAFSRKQMLEMKVVDLNTVITDFINMLQRLIGENIELQIVLESALYPINADPGQIEQVLMNLSINASDAMPDGGILTIETANVYLDYLDDDYANKYEGTQEPGHYVVLTVSDTGCGMDAETRQQVFEPFFTTKEKGKGTGLGLSTVFGIIKQHGGNIWVVSEPEQGTTFKIYLPKENRFTQMPEPSLTESTLAHGTETILVVEDEELVRQLVCETLTAHGYNVLEADNPKSGLKIAAEGKNKIHLLLTDVILPEMHGKALYQKIVAIDPDVKVLYMSGYIDDVIVHHGILDIGVNFIQKPFAVQSLTQKVRQVLNQGD